MIALDAGVLIGLVSAADAHHAAAVRFFEANAAEPFIPNAVDVGESLIRLFPGDRAERVLEQCEILGIHPFDIPGGSAAAIARVRAQSAHQRGS